MSLLKVLSPNNMKKCKMEKCKIGAKQHKNAHLAQIFELRKKY
jgi:hypothetical protein